MIGIVDEPGDLDYLYYGIMLRHVRLFESA
jgi:hypothetical protein